MDTRTRPTYTVRLLSGAQVTMGAWSLGHNLREVRSNRSYVTRLRELLEHCLVAVNDPGPYAPLPDGQLDWREVAARDWDVALLAARIATCGPTLNLRWDCPRNDTSLGQDRCHGRLIRLDANPYEAVEGGFAVDLDHLLKHDVDEIPDTVVESMRRGENRFEVQWQSADGTDHTLEFGIPTGAILEAIHDGPKDRVAAGTWRRDEAYRLAWAMACQIGRLDDVVGRDSVLASLMGDRFAPDLLQVFRLIQQWDGRIDNRIAVRCNTCDWVPARDSDAGQDQEGPGTIEIPFALRSEFWASDLSLKTAAPTRRRRGA